MLRTSNRRIAIIAIIILVLDQITKRLVSHYISDEKTVIPGFFKLVHWGNTGAAWSLFMGNNSLLAMIAIIAIVVLFWNRHHFDAHTVTGQIALGLVFGGIAGNLMDRIIAGFVTDFLYFYLERRGGSEIGFPAFNIADSAICVGVFLIFLLSLKNEQRPSVQPPA